MPELWHHVYGLHVSFNEQQTAVFQWHLGYSLKIFNSNGKNVKRSAVLKNIARKTYSRNFFLNWNSNHFPESGLEPKLKRSVQISGSSFISYQIFIQKLIFQSNLHAHVYECECAHSECDTGV